MRIAAAPATAELEFCGRCVEWSFDTIIYEFWEPKEEDLRDDARIWLKCLKMDLGSDRQTEKLVSDSKFGLGL